MSDLVPKGTAERFTNEFGRSVRVSVRPIELLRVTIEGPDSISENDITRMEAEQLLSELRKALQLENPDA